MTKMVVERGDRTLEAQGRGQPGHKVPKYKKVGRSYGV